MPGHGDADHAAAETARNLLQAAVRSEQVAHRLHAADDPDAIRREVRRLARAGGVRIRTAVVDGVLMVVRADAVVWTESTEVMRRKLTPPTGG